MRLEKPFFNAGIDRNSRTSSGMGAILRNIRNNPLEWRFEGFPVCWVGDMPIWGNKVLLLLGRRNRSENIFRGIIWYSRLGKIRLQQTNRTQISFCLSNYQYFTTPPSWSVLLLTMLISTWSLLKRMLLRQLENFGASQETANRKHVHNEASQLKKIFKIGLTS